MIMVNTIMVNTSQTQGNGLANVLVIFFKMIMAIVPSVTNIKRIVTTVSSLILLSFNIVFTHVLAPNVLLERRKCLEN